MSECCYKVWQWKNNSCQTKRALQSASCSFSPAGLCQNECGILNWTIHHISRVFQLMTLQSDRWRVIRKELCISIPINSLSNSSGKTWPEREEKRKFYPPGEILGDAEAMLYKARYHPKPCSEQKSHRGFFVKSSTVSPPDRYFLLNRELSRETLWRGACSPCRLVRGVPGQDVQPPFAGQRQ